MPAWRREEVEEEEREGAARIVPGRRGEGARKRGGENTCVTMHDVLSPPLRDAPPHGITPSRYSECMGRESCLDLKAKKSTAIWGAPGSWIPKIKISSF